jgi:hypothetical protein
MLPQLMAVPHYAYLKIKMPGPMGIITITGCYKRSIECARVGSQLAESLVIAEEKCQLLREVAVLSQPDVPTPRQPTGNTSFQPAKDSKQIPLDAAHLDKVVTIRAGLNSK